MSLIWEIKYTKNALKQLKKMDLSIRKDIIDYLQEVAESGDPYCKGKALVANKKGLWRYRVRDYRIICDIANRVLIIHSLLIGHRSKIYAE